jgi:hypothetical protein
MTSISCNWQAKAACNGLGVAFGACKSARQQQNMTKTAVMTEKWPESAP